MKKTIEVSTEELVKTPKMMAHLFEMEQKGHIGMKVDGEKAMITQDEGYYCIFCKENGVFEDSDGYCVICGEDNLDIAAVVTH